VNSFLFGLLELEMANLERFWRKTPLGPLGVNATSLRYKFLKIGAKLGDLCQKT
jgi:hypothetical protein